MPNIKSKIELRKIYEHLKQIYPDLSPTRKTEAVQWGELKPEHENIPDYHFLLNLCYGPWRPNRQKQVWEEAYKNFQVVGDIRNLMNILELGFPFDWQKERLKKMREYLIDNSISFEEFLSGIKEKSGIEIRDKFKEIIGGSSTKIYSTFIRDFMQKEDVFPIDSRVLSMLNKLGLPNDENLLVKLCKEHNLPPSLFEGFLYRFKEDFCDNNKFIDCPIREECWCYIMK